MLREYRWQLLSLISAIIVFGVALSTRVLDTSNGDPEPTDAPTASVLAATAVPTAAIVPTSTIEPTVNDATTTAQQPTPVPEVDDVPTYREAVVGQVSRINPLFANLNPVDADISALMFEGLTTINEFGEVVPDLARDWVISFDGLEYVVTLRDDVLWHDGTPFTAADVVYTLSLLQSPDFTGSEERYLFWRTVEVEVINDFLIRFRLAQPIATFGEAMRIGILPEHALRGTTAAQIASHPFNLDPIGTGPYQLEALRGDGLSISAVDLRVAPNYRLRPEGENGYAIERLSLRLFQTPEDALAALQAGRVDGYAARSRQQRPALINVPNMTEHTTFGPSVGLLIFNWVDDDVSFFREERLRDGLALGLDRDLLVARNLGDGAVRADSPILRLSWAYSYGEDINAFWAYDPAAAQAEVETVVERLNRETEDDAEAVQLTFSIMVLDDPALVATASEIATQWSALGMNVIVDPVEEQTYIARLRSADFDTAIVELSKDGNADPDVYAFWHQGQYPDGRNYGGANDRTTSEALERARQDANGVNRIVHYDTFQRAFISRSIAIPLYYPLFTYATTPRLDGVQLGFIGAASDRFMTIQDWQLIE